MHQYVCAGAAAVVLGLLQSVGPARTAPVTIVNHSFETVEAITGFPSTFGDWGVDSSGIVTAENGITPLDGTQMLHFDNTNIEGPAGAAGEVGQAVDLSSHSASIATGAAVLTASAYVNRVAGDAQTDTRFALQLLSFNSGSVLSAFSAVPVVSATTSLFSDSDPSTWEKISASLLLPADTTFVILYLVAIENVFDNLGLPEFDGHYADLVSANINAVPLPASVWLFAAGLGGIGWLARRRRSQTV